MNPSMIPAKLRAVLDDAEVTFSDCVTAFATDPNHPAIAAARDQYHREGECEIDHPTVVSEGDDPEGDYVLAWVWARHPKAVVEGEPAQGELPL